MTKNVHDTSCLTVATGGPTVSNGYSQQDTFTTSPRKNVSGCSKVVEGAVWSRYTAAVATHVA